MARFLDWLKDDISNFGPICHDLFVVKKNLYNADRVVVPCYSSQSSNSFIKVSMKFCDAKVELMSFNGGFYPNIQCNTYVMFNVVFVSKNTVHGLPQQFNFQPS